jgi:hypothetical protein
VLDIFEIGSCKLLARLALHHYPPDLCLQSSQDCRHEPPALGFFAVFFSLLFVIGIKKIFFVFLILEAFLWVGGHGNKMLIESLEGVSQCFTTGQSGWNACWGNSNMVISGLCKLILQT